MAGGAQAVGELRQNQDGSRTLSEADGGPGMKASPESVSRAPDPAGLGRGLAEDIGHKKLNKGNSVTQCPAFVAALSCAAGHDAFRADRVATKSSHSRCTSQNGFS